jgi:hypothetical protein
MRCVPRLFGPAVTACGSFIHFMQWKATRPSYAPFPRFLWAIGSWCMWNARWMAARMLDTFAQSLQHTTQSSIPSSLSLSRTPTTLTHPTSSREVGRRAIHPRCSCTPNHPYTTILSHSSTNPFDFAQIFPLVLSLSFSDVCLQTSLM